MPLDDKDLQRFIAEQGIEAELVYPSEATPTVAAAAAALGVPTKSIVKSLVFVAGTGPHLIIAAGEALIDPKRLRDVLGVSRRNLRMAAPEEALEISGMRWGRCRPLVICGCCPPSSTASRSPSLSFTAAAAARPP